MCSFLAIIFHILYFLLVYFLFQILYFLIYRSSLDVFNFIPFLKILWACFLLPFWLCGNYNRYFLDFVTGAFLSARSIIYEFVSVDFFPQFNFRSTSLVCLYLLFFFFSSFVWMLDTAVYIAGYWICSLPLISVGFCSGVQLSYLKAIWFFWGLLLSFIRSGSE